MKTKYREENCAIAIKHFSSPNFGDKTTVGLKFDPPVVHKTVIEWEEKYPEFREAIQLGLQNKIEWLTQKANTQLKSPERDFDKETWRYVMNATKRAIKCFGPLDMKNPLSSLEEIISVVTKGDAPMSTHELKAITDGINKLIDLQNEDRIDEIETKLFAIQESMGKAKK